MKMPVAARETFDDLLVKPLASTRTLKRRFSARAAEMRETAQPAEAELLSRVLSATQGLLESIERKTSPLYQRLIHAVAEYVMLDGMARGVALHQAAQVVNSVAHSTRRFQLKFDH